MAQTRYVFPDKTLDKAYINGLISNYAWSSSYVTFGFPTSKAQYKLQYGGTYAESETFKAFTSGQQDAARAALANFDDVSNLTFSENRGAAAASATIRYGFSDLPKTAWAYYPHTHEKGGDVWFGNKYGFVSDPLKGGYTYFTTLHETGHAIGLKHPHDSYWVLPADHDSIEYTVMSYKSYVGQKTITNYTVGTGSFPQTLMMDDIRAVQYIYGADYKANSGDTLYRWNPNTGEMSINGVGKGAPMTNKIFMTIWDGGGNDTYDLSNYGSSLKISLQPGQWSTFSTTQLADLAPNKVSLGNLANAYLFKNNPASLIENIIGGSGDDIFYGNIVNNRIDGGDGMDTVVYAGRKTDYSLLETFDDVWSIFSQKTGTDTLVNVELVAFDDEIINLLGVNDAFV